MGLPDLTVVSEFGTIRTGKDWRLREVAKSEGSKGSKGNEAKAVYEVRRIGSFPDGAQWYANVYYDEEWRCIGGDSRWLTVEAADRALAMRLEYNKRWREKNVYNQYLWEAFS